MTGRSHPSSERVLLVLALLAAGCHSALDPDDCRFAPADRCQAYVPQGSLCGLQHTEYWGEDLHPGAACRVGAETTTLVGRTRADTLCPAGWSVGQDVPDEEAEDHGWRSCVSEGNEVSSSARLADVPQGSTCGFNSIGDAAPTANLCLGLDPAVDGCPAGYSLRFGADRTYNRNADPESGDSGGSDTGGTDTGGSDTGGTDTGGTDTGGTGTDEDPNEREAHLLYWCTLDEGCTGEGCRIDGAPVLGLVSVGPSYPAYDTLVLTEEVASQGTSLYAAWEEAREEGARAADAGEVVRHRVLGEDLPWNECPEGLALACTPECTGNGDWAGQDEVPLCASAAAPDSFNFGGLCWCTDPATVVPWTSEDLVTESTKSEG